MAIQLTTINGTDSIAATRITINDNFSTLTDTLNSVLQMVNISTGYFDNATFGSNPKINTGSITALGEISSTIGDIVAYQGNVRTGFNGFLELGANSGCVIKRSLKQLGGGNTTYFIDFAGAIGGTAAGNLSAAILPRQTTAVIKMIQNPELGALVYDISQNVIAYCVATSITPGSTGTWNKISATGATSL
jgi:hypothetical protein